MWCDRRRGPLCSLFGVVWAMMKRPALGVDLANYTGRLRVGPHRNYHGCPRNGDSWTFPPMPLATLEMADQADLQVANSPVSDHLPQGGQQPTPSVGRRQCRLLTSNLNNSVIDRNPASRSGQIDPGGNGNSGLNSILPPRTEQRNALNCWKFGNGVRSGSRRRGRIRPR